MNDLGEYRCPTPFCHGFGKRVTSSPERDDWVCRTCHTPFWVEPGDGELEVEVDA
jgi:hypothetical protein